jgi:hypothetical protein
VKRVPIPRVVAKKNGDLKVVYPKRRRPVHGLLFLGKLAINYINAAPQDVEDYRELRDAVRAYEARKGKK